MNECFSGITAVGAVVFLNEDRLPDLTAMELEPQPAEQGT